MRESNYKIPDGKLVKVKLRVVSEKIFEVRILGDFFLHPEDTILKIEEALIDSPHEKITLTQTIAKVLSDSDATLIGASPADIAKTILMAWDSE